MACEIDDRRDVLAAFQGIQAYHSKPSIDRSRADLRVTIAIETY